MSAALQKGAALLWDAQFRLLRQHAMSVPTTVRYGSTQVIFESSPTVGFNYRMTDTHAAVGREQLKRLMAQFPFASCVPFSDNAPLQEAAGRERTGVLFRAAAYDAPPDEPLQRIEALLGLQGTDTLRYADKRRGQRRAMRLVRAGSDAHLEAFLLAGDTSAESWIRALLQDRLPAQAFGRQLLAPGSKAPVALVPRGKQVCSCFNVAEPAIASHLAGSSGGEDERFASLQSTLKCGTNCGSCVPELKRLVRALIPMPQAA